MENKDWVVGNSTQLLHTRIWDVLETEKTMPNGKTGKFVSLLAPDWVSAIIKNTDTGEFIMSHEYRQGINEWIYEFPCGTMEKGETPEETVIREVAEETGYKNAKIVATLFKANPNPAFMNNVMTCFYIEVSGSPESQHLDNDEFIGVVKTKEPESLLYSNKTPPVMSMLAWEKYKNLK